MLKKIVVPVDGSENSMRAVDYAFELGKKFESELMVVNVVTPHDRATEIRNEVEAVRIRNDEKEEKAKKALQLAEGRVKKLGGYAKIKYTQLSGSDPAEAIIKAAEEQGADTIVIGNRGLGTLSALILGSVSEKLIQSSKIPVLVVK
jgi:nucleotide-binding universal stress UspA family protein